MLYKFVWYGCSFSVVYWIFLKIVWGSCYLNKIRCYLRGVSILRNVVVFKNVVDVFSKLELV